MLSGSQDLERYTLPRAYFQKTYINIYLCESCVILKVVNSRRGKKITNRKLWLFGCGLGLAG